MISNVMIIYLYKKTHNLTGLKYLGKTISKDPHSYTGSGVRWTRHLKKHGYDVTTEILKECTTDEELRYWGRYYSKLWDVVESEAWANLKEEAGSAGKWSTQSKEKLSNTTKQTLSKLSQEERTIRMKNSCCNPSTYTKDRSKKISDALTGLVRSDTNRENSKISATLHRSSLSTDARKLIYGKKNAGKTWKLINGKRVWMEK